MESYEKTHMKEYVENPQPRSAATAELLLLHDNQIIQEFHMATKW